MREGGPNRLERRLGTFDAVMLGLGSMLGAGVFAAFGPAARAAGNALLLGLALAAAVAYCNATSSAQLAALYPESGGAYVYGRKRLGPFWGFLAGSGFVLGKLASCAAMAMTFGSYVSPALARPLAVGAVAALTLVNYQGIQKAAWLTQLLVALVLLALIPLALGIALVVYAAVAASALAGVGAATLAQAPAPLAAAVEAGRLAWLSPAVHAGAALACLGVLLSLIAGVSRTLFAMSRNGDLPALFAAVHPRHRVPHRAELAVGVIAAGMAVVADVRTAIGFSSFAVLTYYAIANAAAWTLRGQERRWPRALSAAGVTGCLMLAFTLPLASVLVGAGLLGLAALHYRLRTLR